MKPKQATGQSIVRRHLPTIILTKSSKRSRKNSAFIGIETPCRKLISSRAILLLFGLLFVTFLQSKIILTSSPDDDVSSFTSSTWSSSKLAVVEDPAEAAAISTSTSCHDGAAVRTNNIVIQEETGKEHSHDQPNFYYDETITSVVENGVTTVITKTRTNYKTIISTERIVEDDKATSPSIGSSSHQKHRKNNGVHLHGDIKLPEYSGVIQELQQERG
jgi:hypothetical protein